MSGLSTPPSTQMAKDGDVAPTGITQLTRHPIHYNVDVPDPIIFQIEGYLYRQSYHYLSKHILFLQRMVELPPPSGGHQGGSDENPVEFCEVGNLTFELVLSIMDLSVYSEACQSHVTEHGILDVLRFSDKWDAPGVQAYCISYLDRAITKKEVHPVLAFSVGRKFNQKSWLKDALKNIQQIPISTWIENPTILSWMAPHDLIVILRLREYTYLTRLDLVCFRPPAVHTSSCRNPQECSFHWDLSWALSVVPRIAHKTFSLINVFAFIMDLNVVDMGEGCAKLSRDAALDSGKFYTDLRGVEKALELI